MKKYAYIILLLFLTTACGTVERRHPAFDDAFKKYHSVAILPPEVTVKYVQFDGDNKRLSELEGRITQELFQETAKLLQEKKYRVLPFNFEEAFRQHDGLSFEFEKLKSIHTSLIQEIYPDYSVSLQKSVEEAYATKKSVGPIVNQFADMANADMLLITNYNGFEKSSGLIAKDIIFRTVLHSVTNSYGGPSDIGGGRLVAALLDGTTGDILWVNIGSELYHPPFTGELGAKDAVEMALEPLPERTPPPR